MRLSKSEASSEKKLNCALSTRSSKHKKIKILPQTAINRKKFTVVGLISNRQI